MSDLPVLSITPPDGRRPLVFSWGVSSYFGWGVHGINLMLHLADHPEVAPYCAMEFGPGDVVVDPLRNQKFAGMAANSQPLWTALRDTPGNRAEIGHMLLEGLGNDLGGAASAYGKVLSGRPSVGVLALENANITQEGRQRAENYALIVAVSRWNEMVVRRHGIRTVTTVHLGVDTSLYHPAPRTGLFPGRFVIFSGGKLEFRKAQDLVLAGFRAFRQRHPEALLVTAWHSPWSHLSEIAVGHPGITTPPPRGEDGTPDVVGWAVANGIPPDDVISIGPTANLIMPHVVREADVALFPNRCEGGTNMVAMECMACGIPTIMSANTGHMDLLRHGIALPLERQGTPQSPHYDTTEWGESDVDEIVEKLETVWRDRTAAAALGARAAHFMAGMDWPEQLRLFLRALEPFVP